MHEDYKDRRKANNKETKTISARIPQDLSAALEGIAFAEDDSVSNIVLEGIYRVIDARTADETYVDRSTKAISDRIAQMVSQSELAIKAIRENLGQ